MNTKEQVMLGTALVITAALGYLAFRVASNCGFNAPSQQAAPADPLSGLAATTSTAGPAACANRKPT